MANCNEQRCKELRKKLARSNTRVKRRRERLDAAGWTLGISAGASIAVISVWLAEALAVNAGVTVAFPGIGWIIGGVAVTVLATYALLFRQYVAEVNKRTELCQRAHDVCDHECLPGYCR
ncbi:hypothetical protein [uncultured Dokdonia sp.]|uniref:hypothetical protein n=1 Tax=uncultured Dokdonia sp. TaxID=575653 RepID=UPI00262D0B47|nr:hypothetical protein [uncultured Dokdonia sp.]